MAVIIGSHTPYTNHVLLYVVGIMTKREKTRYAYLVLTHLPAYLTLQGKSGRVAAAIRAAAGDSRPSRGRYRRATCSTFLNERSIWSVDPKKVDGPILSLSLNHM